MNHLSIFIIFSIIFGVCLSDDVKEVTKWDLENICFTKADNQTFNFTLSSLNNSRKYNGTTYRESDDPKFQRMKVDDRGTKGAGIYEINFTDDELRSDEIFCRGHGKLLYFLTGDGTWLDVRVLLSLV